MKIAIFGKIHTLTYGTNLTRKAYKHMKRAKPHKTREHVSFFLVENYCVFSRIRDYNSEAKRQMSVLHAKHQR